MPKNTFKGHTGMCTHTQTHTPAYEETHLSAT